ncbi:MAG: hypothetical protein QNL04_10430 [SAR324 cluster bacterium]|nr:hypothetical protein [SAR324 cluster bacterium]
MKKILLFCLTILFILQSSSAFALLFDRRPKPKAELSYFVYPVAGKLPGVQEFSGYGASVIALGGSETDIAAIKLGGPADYFENDDFEITLFTILDFPLYTEHLTLNAYKIDVINGTWPEGERGINSDPDSTYYLLASTFSSSGAELSLNFWEYQLEFYYGYLDGSVTPYGLIDPTGKFYNAEEAKLIKKPRGYRWGIYLDDTDDRRDPRIGYRVQYEKWGMPATREGNSGFFQEDLNLTSYLPILDNNKGILVLNYFFGSSTVTEKGTVDRTQFICPTGAADSCQTLLDDLYQRQVENANRGKATSLGGANRLRGYRTNRFYDSYTAFRGAEFRWYAFEAQEAFDFFVEKGTFAGFQLALFAESGTVAPTKAELWDSTRTSYGFGLRPIFNTVVVRLDIGWSEEEKTTTLFFGYPF